MNKDFSTLPNIKQVVYNTYYLTHYPTKDPGVLSISNVYNHSGLYLFTVVYDNCFYLPEDVIKSKQLIEYFDYMISFSKNIIYKDLSKYYDMINFNHQMFNYDVNKFSQIEYNRSKDRLVESFSLPLKKEFKDNYVITNVYRRGDDKYLYTYVYIKRERTKYFSRINNLNENYIRGHIECIKSDGHLTYITNVDLSEYYNMVNFNHLIFTKNKIKL